MRPLRNAVRSSSERQTASFSPALYQAYGAARAKGADASTPPVEGATSSAAPLRGSTNWPAASEAKMCAGSKRMSPPPVEATSSLPAGIGASGPGAPTILELGTATPLEPVVSQLATPPPGDRGAACFIGLHARRGEHRGRREHGALEGARKNGARDVADGLVGRAGAGDPGDEPFACPRGAELQV